MSKSKSPTTVTDHRLGGHIGEEVGHTHSHDPLCILPASGSSHSNGDSSDPIIRQLRRKVSFYSSPLALGKAKIDTIDETASSEDSQHHHTNTATVPIVKILNTSRADINGKFGYVHAYYRTRERYAVTLLEGGSSSHPALVYFNLLGPVALNSGHTLFLPLTTVVRLSHLDKVSLYLQYVALQIFGSPELACQIDHVVGILQYKVFPLLKLEYFSMFIVLLLPISLERMFYMVSLQWKSYYWGDSSSVDHSLNDTSRGGGGAFSLLSLISNFIGLITDHVGEIFTITLLLVGSSTIARFLISEYRLVKEKAEAMISHQESGRNNDNVENEKKKEQKSFTTMEMFEYRIDYHFSTSKWAKVALLLSFTFILIAVGAGLLVLFMDDRSISNAVWIAWTYVADPGTHADCPEAFLIRVISFTVTLGGMLIFALMIGIISDYIAETVDDLKKGKSRIIDIDHTVMLGWNDKSLAIIQQIALANESEGGGAVVVLADNDKEELETTLASAVVSNENPLRLLGTEVIFRSGNPLLESELRRVSTQTARCVISLSQEDIDPDEADATQVRQVMALKAFEEFEGSKAHVVVEVQDVDNQELFPLVAPDFAEVVVTHDIIGRLMLQCARCPGLASVLEAMMGFEGSEFYFEEWPELTGKTFYDITCRFDEAIPIGIKAASDGKVYINPENDHVVNEGDKILVLAEDNDSYEVNGGDYKITGISKVPCLLADIKKVEKIMFCGWRRDMSDMIMQLDEYVEKGSELWLLNMVPAKERVSLLKDKGNKEDLQLDNLTICNVVGNPVIRRDLNNIQAVDDDGKATDQTITMDQFDSILILADAVAIENGANMMSCDSRSLSSLLIMQDIQKKLYDERRKTDPNIKVPCDPISEILDSRTKSLLAVANCKGYIMSNQIISSVIAQVSEEKDINAVLREILTAEGSETYIRSVTRFVDLEKEDVMSFWDIALRARQLREVAVGYKPAGMDFLEAEELIINPPDKSVKRKWDRGDKIITFSMD